MLRHPSPQSPLPGLTTDLRRWTFLLGCLRHPLRRLHTTSPSLPPPVPRSLVAPPSRLPQLGFLVTASRLSLVLPPSNGMLATSARSARTSAIRSLWPISATGRARLTPSLLITLATVSSTATSIPLCCLIPPRTLPSIPGHRTLHRLPWRCRRPLTIRIQNAEPTLSLCRTPRRHCRLRVTAMVFQLVR